MNLLKLVIVDDEAILLKGLAETFDWASMGFQVVGTALSGEQAMDVIEETKPDVVLTDIRMKQMTGLQLMEEVKAKGNDCLFIVLSAYRDFSYAKQACDLGAIAYLLKPIEEEQLQEVMSNTHKLCMEQQAMIKKVENLEKLLHSLGMVFLDGIDYLFCAVLSEEFFTHKLTVFTEVVLVSGTKLREYKAELACKCVCIVEGTVLYGCL